MAEIKIAGSSIWRSIGNLSLVLAAALPTGAAFAGSDNFAGVAFDLVPGASYDLRLTGTEPGVGTWQLTGTQGTRALPGAAPAPNKTATPATIAAQLLTLVAGDCLQLADGTYPPITLARSGTNGVPIYIRGATRTGVIISDSARCVDWSNSSNVVLENLTLQGSGVDSGTAANSAGVIYRTDYNQTNTTIRNVTFSGTDRGCKSYTEVYGRLIYNCTFTGNNTWAKTYEINPASGAPNYTWSDDGVGGPGVGNCVWNCTFSGHGDTIKQGGSAVTSGVTYCGANFTYRCRITRTGDDACEFDDGGGNCAFYDNTVDNCGQAASFDGVYGGPIYFFRNSIGNTSRGPLKPSSFSKHVKIWANTFVRTTGAVNFNFYAPYATPNDNWSVLGNIIIYRGIGEVLRLDAVLGNLEWDYNALYPSTENITLGAGRGALAGLTAAKAALAPLMAHDVAVVSNPFAATITMATNYTTEYVGSMDFTLAAGVSVRNAGVAIPGITDGFSGSAPDMGAVISGRSILLIGDQASATAPLPVLPTWAATIPWSISTTPAAVSAPGFTLLASGPQSLDFYGLFKSHSGLVYMPAIRSMIGYGADTHGSGPYVVGTDVPTYTASPRIIDLGTMVASRCRSDESFPNYRIDAAGVPWANAEHTAPWAMHVFRQMMLVGDEVMIVYNAINHANLFEDGITPIPREGAATSVRPCIWFYKPSTNTWRYVDGGANNANVAGIMGVSTGLAYSQARNSVMGIIGSYFRELNLSTFALTATTVMAPSGSQTYTILLDDGRVLAGAGGDSNSDILFQLVNPSNTAAFVTVLKSSFAGLSAYSTLNTAWAKLPSGRVVAFLKNPSAGTLHPWVYDPIAATFTDSGHSLSVGVNDAQSGSFWIQCETISDLNQIMLATSRSESLRAWSYKPSTGV